MTIHDFGNFKPLTLPCEIRIGSATNGHSCIGIEWLTGGLLVCEQTMLSPYNKYIRHTLYRVIPWEILEKQGIWGVVDLPLESE